MNGTVKTSTNNLHPVPTGSKKRKRGLAPRKEAPTQQLVASATNCCPPEQRKIVDCTLQNGYSGGMIAAPQALESTATGRKCKMCFMEQSEAGDILDLRTNIVMKQTLNSYWKVPAENVDEKLASICAQCVYKINAHKDLTRTLKIRLQRLSNGQLRNALPYYSEMTSKPHIPVKELEQQGGLVPKTSPRLNASPIRNLNGAKASRVGPILITPEPLRTEEQCEMPVCCLPNPLAICSPGIEEKTIRAFKNSDDTLIAAAPKTEHNAQNYIEDTTRKRKRKRFQQSTQEGAEIMSASVVGSNMPEITQAIATESAEKPTVILANSTLPPIIGDAALLQKECVPHQLTCKCCSKTYYRKDYFSKHIRRCHAVARYKAATKAAETAEPVSAVELQDNRQFTTLTTTRTSVDFLTPPSQRNEEELNISPLMLMACAAVAAHPSIPPAHSPPLEENNAHNTPPPTPDNEMPPILPEVLAEESSKPPLEELAEIPVSVESVIQSVDAPAKESIETSLRRSMEPATVELVEAPAKDLEETSTILSVCATTNVSLEAPTKVLVEAPIKVSVEVPTNTPLEAPTNMPLEAPTNDSLEAPTNVPLAAPTNVSEKAASQVPSLQDNLSHAGSSQSLNQRNSMLEIFCERTESALFTESGGKVNGKVLQMVCQRCSKVYWRKNFYVRHVKRCHARFRIAASKSLNALNVSKESDTNSPIGGRRSTRPRVFHCSECSVTVENITKLRQHKRIHMHHLYCETCGKDCTTKYDYDFHSIVCKAQNEALNDDPEKPTRSKSERTTATRMTRSRSRADLRSVTCASSRYAVSSVFRKHSTHKSYKEPSSDISEDEYMSDDDDDSAVSVPDTMYSKRLQSTVQWVQHHPPIDDLDDQQIPSYREYELYLLDRLKDEVDLNLYSCFAPNCDFQADRLVEVMIHDFVDHFKGAYFYCKKCGHVFTSKVFLDYHLDRQNIGRYMCFKCGDTFNFQNELDRHLLRHTKSVNYGCNYCKFEFLTEHELLQHCENEQHEPNEERNLVRIDPTMTIVNDAPPPETNRRTSYMVTLLDMQTPPMISKRPVERSYRRLVGNVEFNDQKIPNCWGWKCRYVDERYCSPCDSSSDES